MRFILSCSVVIVLSVLLPFTVLAGTLSLSLDGLTVDQLTGVSVVVVRVGGEQPEVVYQGDGVAISTAGIEVADGTYHLYLEDMKTGLIIVEDNDGTGYVLAGSQAVMVTVADFTARVEEVKSKDAEERQRIEEESSQGGGATMAVGSGGGDGDEYAPGELLIRYAPWTTLVERYAFPFGSQRRESQQDRGARSLSGEGRRGDGPGAGDRGIR